MKISSRIVSSVPGRIRLRDPALRQTERLERLREKLAALDGVSSLRANAAAGSLVVGYAAAGVDTGRMAAAIDAAAAAILGAAMLAARPRVAQVKAVEPPTHAQAGISPSLRVRVNRQAKRGMLASLAASLLLAVLGGKRWHVVSGGVFLVFLMLHLAVHRRHLLR